jgi:hypothetical protein
MKNHSSLRQKISSVLYSCGIAIAMTTFSYTNAAHADIDGIPYNPDFPKAQYPYSQAPDACSGVTDRPDSNGEIRDTWGPVDFRGACNTHDKCYYTYGSNWKTCNERFYSDLRSACERDLRVSTPFGKTPPDPLRLAACYKIATTYYAGVQAGVSIGVFSKAQDKQKRYERWISDVRNRLSDIYIGIVRNNAGSLYSILGTAPVYLGSAKWDTCPNNTKLLGRDFQANGFWVCAAPRIANKGTWYFGNVVSNQGYYWEVASPSRIKSIGSAKWDTCKTGRFSGRLFNSNGFWLCQP